MDHAFYSYFFSIWLGGSGKEIDIFSNTLLALMPH